MPHRPAAAHLSDGATDREPFLVPKAGEGTSRERFVVIADARFSALMASVRTDEEGQESAGDEVIWSFEPDIVYSALEYLMARVTAELPDRAHLFSKAVRTCVPKTTSLQLTVSVTTKLARLLQEQAAVVHGAAEGRVHRQGAAGEGAPLGQTGHAVQHLDPQASQLVVAVRHSGGHRRRDPLA